MVTRVTTLNVKYYFCPQYFYNVFGFLTLANYVQFFLYANILTDILKLVFGMLFMSVGLYLRFIVCLTFSVFVSLYRVWQKKVDP